MRQERWEEWPMDGDPPAKCVWGIFTMIRGIIGTLAVLAAFAVIETSSGASTGSLNLGGDTCTPAQAYALLQPGEGLAIRAEPTPHGEVIGHLSVLDAADDAPLVVTVTLTASQSGWARIALQPSAREFSAAGDAAPSPAPSHGWMPADLLTVDARVDGPIAMHSRPGLMGRALGTIRNDTVKFRVLGCRGAWLQVINARDGNVWIDKWCARPDEGCRAAG